MFAMMLVAAMNLQSVTVRTLWAKERSAHWWDDVVKEVFTQQDWLENFRLSRETFFYVCNELRSIIEKTDTVMRKAIPVTEQRIALTL